MRLTPLTHGHKGKWKCPSLSLVGLFATPWTVAHQFPLFMGFSGQEYWSGLPFPPPGDLPHPGIEPVSPVSPALQADSLPGEPSGNGGLTLCRCWKPWDFCGYYGCIVDFFHWMCNLTPIWKPISRTVAERSVLYSNSKETFYETVKNKEHIDI